MSTSTAGSGWAAGGPQSATQRLHAAMQRVRAFDTRHPLVWNAGLALLVALPGLLQILYGEGVAPDVDHPPHAASTAEAAGVPAAVPWLVLAGLVLPLVWRRRRPFGALCAIVVVLVVQDEAGLDLISALGIGMALYNIALRLPLSRLAWVAGIILAGFTAEILTSSDPDSLRESISLAAIAATIAMAGITVRSRREYVASLLERAERLEVERDQKAQLAAAAERSRIAREMHDIVAHNLSVIVGLADGGSYAAKGSPERPAQALVAISDTGRQALGELRRLLGVLHEQGAEPAAPAELAPQPGLAELEPLLARVRAAGLPVRSTVSGDAGSLSEGRQLAVYRIVQEALTNTFKHAGGGTTAQVKLHCADGAADIEISDTGRGAASAGAAANGAGAGGGRGISGMRERAAVYDGTLEAGPAPGGGWRVRCRLPAESRAGAAA